MIPGPSEYYKCPHCGQISMRGSLISGNTFGAELFSDGKRIAPMLPEFPLIVKCKNCKMFYWLNEKNKVPELNFPNKTENVNIKADEAEFLSIDEYQEIIDSKFNENEDEHKYFRMRLWWAFNDKLRENNNEDFSESENKLFEFNCLKLIDILNKDDINEKIMIAELYRNIGNFIESKKILDTIKKDDYNWIKIILENECLKENKKVILLRQ